MPHVEIDCFRGERMSNIYFGNRDFFAKEIGYIVNKNYQRCGYASEAIRGVLEHAGMKKKSFE